jgi:hypothetical protein
MVSSARLNLPGCYRTLFQPRAAALLLHAPCPDIPLRARSSCGCDGRLEAVLLDAGFSKDDFDRAVLEMDKNKCAALHEPSRSLHQCHLLSSWIVSPQ